MHGLLLQYITIAYVNTHVIQYIYITTDLAERISCFDNIAWDQLILLHIVVVAFAIYLILKKRRIPHSITMCECQAAEGLQHHIISYDSTSYHIKFMLHVSYQHTIAYSRACRIVLYVSASYHNYIIRCTEVICVPQTCIDIYDMSASMCDAHEWSSVFGVPLLGDRVDLPLMDCMVITVCWLFWTYPCVWLKCTTIMQPDMLVQLVDWYVCWLLLRIICFKFVLTTDWKAAIRTLAHIT